MPYKIQWFSNGVIMEFHGIVSTAEVEDANEDFFSDDRSDTMEYQIIDAIMVTSVELNDFNIEEVAALDRGASILLPNLRLAYVATNMQVVTTLEKYVEISKRLNSTWKFKGFRELCQAKKWVAQDE